MISVILPINKNEPLTKIKRCLESFAWQTYQDLEVIVATFPNAPFLSLFKKYPFVKVLTGKWQKTIARNTGAKKAKGDYLFHIDVDMRFPKNLLEECLRIVKRKNCQAIALHYKEIPKKNFLSQCRALERKIFFKDPILESPEFIEKSLFEKIGGFDPQVDLLDDWDLALAVKSLGVKFYHLKQIATRESEFSLRKTAWRMFKRGQTAVQLKKKYPKIPQLETKRKLKIYFKNPKIFLASPILAAGLLILKIIDAVCFGLGMLFPKKSVNLKNPYFSFKLAQEYEKKRLATNYGRYKHFAELQGISTLLGQKPRKILEIGCGTGRITAELTKMGHQVVPTDPSEVMLRQFKKRLGLPKPLKISSNTLPFKENQFPVVLAVRVVWHLPKNQMLKTLFQMIHASSKFVILDIANKKRLLARFLIGQNTYPLSLDEFKAIGQKMGLRLEKVIPLEVSLPFWLNFLPKKLAKRCFFFVLRLDFVLGKFISPGRYLLKLSKISH